MGIQFPEDLVSLYLETNGVYADYAPFVFSIEDLEDENNSARQLPPDLYMPLEHFLFFGGNGGGDLFGYRIVDSGRVDGNIFRWDHENDSRTWFASSLRDYLQRAAKGMAH